MEKNTIIFNGVETDTFVEKTSVRIIYLLGKLKKLKYADNPPVAAIVNGELKSLQSEITENAVIDLVNLDTSAGRTVYRHTLSFLLCYASSIIYPEKTLVIGHSLGDGYYFHYRNKEKVDVEKLKAVMKKAIEDDLMVDIITLSAKQALQYTQNHNLTETEKLLITRNDGSYQFNRIGDCLSVAYEPLLPSLKYLEVWDLMEYGDGLLLRYPQSRCKDRLMDFQDNPLLFKVFDDAKKKAEVLDLQSLGSLNMKFLNGRISETVILSETLQRRKFYEAASMIKERGNVKVAFVAGPTSSGKKTCSLKLCAELRIQGYQPILLSLDDYRRVGEKGVTIDTLDLDFLRQQVKELLEGKEVELANLSGYDPHRCFREETAKMGENSILVIEGVQTLNENLIPDLDDKEVFRIYVSALTQLNLDTRSGISTTDNRLIRRLIKECRTKYVTPSEILAAMPKIDAEE
ncbi:MAG: hypothetical protein KBS81_10620 [Spirochaetales bacterium]|nr:hypothetical protein [Candidatus Physcosoma equi]